MPRRFSQSPHQISATGDLLVLHHGREKRPIRLGELCVGNVEDAIFQFTLSPLRTGANVFDSQESIVGMHAPCSIAQKLKHEGKSVDSLNRFGQCPFVDKPAALFNRQAKGLFHLVRRQGAQIEALGSAKKRRVLAAEKRAYMER